jgi:PAS domain S-box-containing protein
MSLVVRVITPTGRDAELITDVLKQNGIEAKACPDYESLSKDLELHPIGPLLIAEEALTSESIDQLSQLIQKQPPWSDLPILILTGGGREPLGMKRLELERLPLGTPILLERPIRTAMLVSSVRAAVCSRKRQYEIRDAIAALRQEQETLQAVLDHLPIGVLLAKPTGEIVLGNRSVERILRHPVKPTSDINGHGKWVAFHADGRRVAGDEYPLPRAMRSGLPVPPEDYLYQRGDGSLGWVNLVAAPIFDDRGAVAGGIVAVSDIDSQKRADAALRRSNERFRRLLENASIGVIIGDPDGRISYANPVILDLLGYSAEEVESGAVRWNCLSPAEYAEADRLALERLLAVGKSDSYQREYVSKDGSLIPFLIGATVLPSQKGAGGSSEIALFLTDLTNQKKTESALIQSEKLAAVGRLAASISHEINNPLESVTNLIFLARQSSKIPTETRELLDKADHELSRVSQIVAQTLRFHRQSTKPRKITTAELLEPTLGLYRGRIANSQIELRLEHRDSPAITCYEGDVRQVLNNLIGNAIDSMRLGGRLTIRTGWARQWRRGTKGVRISVADTGHGIPPEVADHIFEPFYTTKGINGTGLGLWISSEIVNKHGGHLQMRSQTQSACHGTVFSLFLPIDLQTVQMNTEVRKPI